MIERILVPLDGSATAERVLVHVRRLLRTSKAEVMLLRAYNVIPLEADYVDLVGRLRAEAEAYIHAVEARLEKDGLRVRAFTREGPSAEVILDAAQRERADLIAMSTHGRTGLARFAFGSVAEKVVRSSPVPVLVVRSYPEEKAKAESPMRNVVVPYDGSPTSLQVAAVVKELFRPLDAHVHLVHVLEEVWKDVKWALPEHRLKEAADDFIGACLPTTVETRTGDPANEILEAARARDADVIAMATHGRSGVSRWMIGSVTEKVLRAADVPVLVVRAKKEAGHA
jgi:nucleotide-binding universal stress UspA family protein